MGCFLLANVMLHLLLFNFPSYSSLCNHHDQSSLLQFKNSITVNTSHYYSWLDVCSSFPSKTESWTNATNCCQWNGVTCDMSGHVIGLDLSCSHLQGQLHPNSTIFSLRHLQQLNLAYNDFSGSPLSYGIGDLVNLVYLNLSYSVINGDVPSTISHLSKLVSLDLSSDWGSVDDPMPLYLSIRIHPHTWNKLIHNATKLREIHLDGMDFSSVRENSLLLLTNLSSTLVSLTLSSTLLQSKFPSGIFCSPNLQKIDLSFNEWLRGELPKSNLSPLLRYLDVSGTAFSGEIPNSIGHSKSFNHINLASCKFYGLIPSSLFHLTQLSLLDLSENGLVGPIPHTITQFPKLHTLGLASNKLNGTIPSWCYSLPCV